MKEIKKKEKMKKILIGYYTEGFNGGIDKYVDMFVKSIKDENIKIDFLTKENSSTYNTYKISKNRRPIKQLKEMIKIIKKGKYDIAYFNISESFNCIGIIAAKLCGVKKIIVHSHSSGEDTKNKVKRKLQELLNWVCKPIISICCNSYLTCSDLAAKWLYSKSIVKNKEYELIYNAVDDNKFKYNEVSRNKIREELSIKDKFIIGHVGRFCEPKNQKFLLDILKNVFDKKDDAIAIMVGDGEEFNDVKQYAKKLEIDKKIIFTGNVNNVEKYMSAFDVFVLPSKLEGLPIVGVEAQFSGLPCLFSDTITEELIIGKNSKSLSINDCKLWSDEILKIDKRENVLTEKANNFKLGNAKQQFNSIIDDNNVIKEKKKSFSSGLFLKLILTMHFILNLTCYLNGFNYLLVFVGILMLYIVIFNVKNYKKIIQNKIYILFGIFIVSYLITFIVNQKYNVIGSIKVLIWLMLHLFFGFGCYYISSDYQLKKEIKYVTTLFIIAISILNINNLILLLLHTSSIVYSFDNEALLVGLTSWGRFYGIFYDPNYTSVICMIAILFAIYLFKEYKNITARICLAMSIMLQLMYIFFCESRSGLVTLICASIVYVIANMIVSKNFKKNIQIAIVEILVIISLVTVPKVLINTYNNIQKNWQTEKSEERKEIEKSEEKKETEKSEEKKEEKIEIGRKDNKEDISNRRFAIWKSGFEIFSKNIIFGIGFSNIIPMALDKYPETYIVNNDFSNFNAFHNSIIDVFTSQGVAGGIIMIVIYMYGIIETIKKRKVIFDVNNKYSREIIMLITCLISIVVSSMFLSEIYYINNACTFIFWVLFGYYDYLLIGAKGEKNNDK